MEINHRLKDMNKVSVEVYPCTFMYLWWWWWWRTPRLILKQWHLFMISFYMDKGLRASTLFIKKFCHGKKKNVILLLFCSVQVPICWWIHLSTQQASKLNCCCTLWVKMTPTVCNSATSYIAVMATVQAGSVSMCRWMADHMETRFGTFPDRRAANGTR